MLHIFELISGRPCQVELPVSQPESALRPGLRPGRLSKRRSELQVSLAKSLTVTVTYIIIIIPRARLLFFGYDVTPVGHDSPLLVYH